MASGKDESVTTGTWAPEDAEAYAKKVAEAIKADVR
ncbi:unnamed protein product [Ectocarpus sp. CCAP 1310/34]|nr:unnamed protein product [Ectocarpus sp. CCAP 1310/34]